MNSKAEKYSELLHSLENFPAFQGTKKIKCPLFQNYQNKAKKYATNSAERTASYTINKRGLVYLEVLNHF